MLNSNVKWDEISVISQENRPDAYLMKESGVRSAKAGAVAGQFLPP